MELTMPQQDIQANIDKVNKLYADFKRQLKILTDQQQAIISKFIEHLENTKLEQIRKTINK